MVKSTYYDSVNIEIAYYKSNKPSNAVLNYFKSEIKKTGIAKEVNIILYPVTTPPTLPWNQGLLHLFEDTNRIFVDDKPGDFDLFLFVAYLPGPFVEGSYNNLAGLAYGETSFAIFSDGISDKEEGYTLLHELAHLMEFVDVKARGEKEHANPERPRHCNNRACIMFWQISREQKGLDKDCMKQLRAKIRERRRQPEKAERIGPL